jgi:cytochrome c oxidase subunit II
MTGGALAIWAAMVALAIHAIWSQRQPHDERRAKLLIVAGGVVFPTVTLAGLLTYGLALLPGLVAAAPPGSLRIEVSGRQWWWHMRYLPADGEPVEVANEIRLPVGEPVEFQLESIDVIHSFWIPALGGKMDMLPGRRTRLVLQPTRVGTFRGVCAEYCGSAHARMAFDVHVVEREDFEGWLARQREPAAQPEGAFAARGAELFRENGCGACHRIRGTASNGAVGPDLTHVAGRASLGAGTLGNGRDDILRWLADPESLKPGVHMPAFHMLPEPELRALAAYLESLR